jgi:beta,beta-carotene 9',10'-dioxygenase
MFRNMTPSMTAVGTALGFEDLGREHHDPVELDVEGELPFWLDGALIRTGPARFDFDGGSVNHWFDGMAMLHRFGFGDGRVTYRNRFLRSRAYEATEASGRIGFREFGTDPCRSAFRRVASMFASGSDLTDNGAVNVVALEDRWLALTETPMAVAFDPETLETVGMEARRPATTPTAHPHVDRATGALVGVGTHLARKSSYRIFTGERVDASIPVAKPAYMHAFGLTDRFAIVNEGAFVVDPLRLLLSGRPFIENFRWEPERGSRLWVVDRSAGRVVGSWETDPHFAFHHVNAFEDGAGRHVVDLLAHDDAEVVAALGLQRLRAGDSTPWPRLKRYEIDLEKPGTQARERTVTNLPWEMPQIAYAGHNGRPYRYAWGAGPSEQGGWFDQVVKVDVTTGEHLAWREYGAYPGEPVHVPRPGATTEDDGVLLTVVLEPERRASALVVLDARDLEPLARAEVAHHIPFGFHGRHAAA